MVNAQQKQMLYISVREEDPSLYFEIEPYYSRQDRQIHTERPLESFDPAVLIKDDTYLEDVGFSLILRLLLPESLKDSKGRAWAQIVYPHERHGNPVLRIDEEPYQYKPHREFCTSMALSTMDVGKAIEDEDLKIQVVKIVLRYLPLRGQ